MSYSDDHPKAEPAWGHRMTVLSGLTIAHAKILRPTKKRTLIERPDGLKLTYGLGPCGYDVTVEFDASGRKKLVVLAPGEFLLASTCEFFAMPESVVGIVHDKSTWARLGLCVQNTVIEPGWCGWLTLELTNHSKDPITLYRGDPIAQVIFHRTDIRCVSYRGRYQNQARGPQAVKFNKEKPRGKTRTADVDRSPPSPRKKRAGSKTDRKPARRNGNA